MKRNDSFLTYLLIIGAFLFFSIGCEKDEYNNPNQDIDGNTYDTVRIGTQTWMLQNLRTTRFNDGTSIPGITDSSTWVNLTTPGSSIYKNTANVDTISTYGRLYNWYAVNTGKLCPVGWHVPTEEEWTTLSDYLGGKELAGGKLKESGTIHWNSSSSGADNSSGFTALPGGNRGQNANYYNIGDNAYFWSQTIGYYINSNTNSLNTLDLGKKFGLSIRCIKDTE